MSRGKKLKKYISPFARPVLISMGKYHGVFVLGNFTVTGPLPALLKVLRIKEKCEGLDLRAIHRKQSSGKRLFGISVCVLL